MPTLFINLKFWYFFLGSENYRKGRVGTGNWSLLCKIVPCFGRVWEETVLVFIESDFTKRYGTVDIVYIYIHIFFFEVIIGTDKPEI